MGIIIKQSIKGSLWSYLGVLIGFVTTSYLYPNFLTTDMVGLFGLFGAYATLFGQFSMLGSAGVTSRLFPYFRNNASGHHGFVAITALFMAVGFSLFLLAYFLFSPLLMENNQEKSALFADYIYLLVPLTFFAMIYTQLDTYNKVLYDAVSGIFLQDFLQRVFLFLLVVVFALGLINHHQLILGYATVISLKGLLILILLFLRGEIHFRTDFKFINKSFLKEMIDVAAFSILGGLGTMAVFNIDKIVVNQILDLSNTGVYTIAFYFGTLVVIPSRPLLKISGTLIADAWAEGKLAAIRDIYYKSCLNQFIIGGFLFLGIWANIHNILIILGDDYVQSKWVIFFIGLGYLFDMLTGANAQVLAFSKHYRVSLYFVVVLIAVVGVLLYVLTPLWGIVGAAVSIAAGLFLNNLMRYSYLLWKFKLQPFNYKFLIVAIILISAFLIQELIARQNLFIDIFLRGFIITSIYLPTVYYLKISPDINASVDKILRLIKKAV
ncbi:lipopolysaccharide biosynthesis protein [Gaoshiqia sediminis]|uniref:Polysaccharide biosynthesis C-terminal domain-containing protein n=1 Tax=Gaoshiqia sediminis TaxID=2986998 RepID=A0AA41Y686_9BACT|nr:lipopolysaccharide biosynthesis protein [Gaoshiqia sediminis]MCW0482694.1 polysaccharide biosynthesis C-terminal domain-containing protein [Gaoshiqia sediminis]